MLVEDLISSTQILVANMLGSRQLLGVEEFEKKILIQKLMETIML